MAKKRAEKINFSEQLQCFQIKKFKAITENQQEYINIINNSTITFVEGPSGCGKSYVATACGVKLLLENKIEKIIITRPIVECDEHIGFLPGQFFDKVLPYMIPVLDVLLEFLTPKQLQAYQDDKIIEICPLAYMRGRSLHNSYIIGDELQNASYKQLKMLLTRIGYNSKMVLNGDVSQSDVGGQNNAFEFCLNRLCDVNGIGIIKLEKVDIVRNEIISRILEKLD
mgnify:CR=1 FL=1